MSARIHHCYMSLVMKATLDDAWRAAQSDSVVLLQGESGSGKDFLAGTIHQWSRRKDGPLVSINCSAIPPDLFESELFGHEPGAFTSAAARKPGLIETAQDGTLFLNEIGEIPKSVQPKLLAFLDTRTFRRVGGTRPIQVNVRIIVATNRNLAEMVSERTFRADLFYRLNVFLIVVPPLRDRKEDMPLLAKELLGELAVDMGRDAVPALEQAALNLLVKYDWPGNVRELKHVLERALLLSRGTTIRIEDITFQRCPTSHDGAPQPGDPSDAVFPVSPSDRLWSPITQCTDPRLCLQLTDEQFKRMIGDVFGDSATPVEVVSIVLGWKRKQVSAAVRRVGCLPGKAGRLPKALKALMISQLRRWLQDDGFL